MKKILAVVAIFTTCAAVVLGLGHLALAQVPGLYIVSPNGSEQVNVLNAGPQIATVYLKQARDAAGYSKQSPTSGTLTFAAGGSQMQIGGSSTITALTINLTQAPVDGQINCFYTKPAITTLTLAAASGQTLNDAVTSTSATTRTCYLYSLSNLSWDRIQ